MIDGQWEPAYFHSYNTYCALTLPANYCALWLILQYCRKPVITFPLKLQCTIHTDSNSTNKANLPKSGFTVSTSNEIFLKEMGHEIYDEMMLIHEK